MTNIYYIESNNHFLINNKIKDLFKDQYEIITYDMSDYSINNVITELDTSNLFNNHKLILCYNCLFLSLNPSKTDNSALERLSKYLSNPSPDNILILCQESFDNRKKIIKLLKETSTEIKLNLDPVNYIKTSLKDYTLNQDAINLIINYSNGDISQIHNELNKISLYIGNTKTMLTVNDIKPLIHLVIDESDNHIFKLIDNIINRNINAAMETYKDLNIIGVDPLKILVLTANQIRLIYQVKILSVKENNDSIAKRLKIHPYRIKLSLANSYNYTYDELIKLLKKISLIDLQIKKGELNPDLGVSLLITSNY